MFKIGDKVRVIKNYDDAEIGDEGVIKALPMNNGASKEGRFGECYSVEFPSWEKRGHSCNRIVPSGKGQWVLPKCLELIKPKSEKIVITHDGKTTLARLYENNKVVKSAEAKCSPDDEFNFETGAKRAFERLTEEKKEAPKFDKSMLTNGRFGYISDNDWFVVVDDKIIYKKGDYDTLEDMNASGRYNGYGVKCIVDALSFNNARDNATMPNKVIWCAPDFDPKKV